MLDQVSQYVLTIAPALTAIITVVVSLIIGIKQIKKTGETQVQNIDITTKELRKDNIELRSQLKQIMQENLELKGEIKQLVKEIKKIK